MSVIVLDRDGVINQDSKDYIKSAIEWQPIPGSIEAIKTITDKGYKIYIATNQAGIGRGLFSRQDLEGIHDKMTRVIEAAGGKIQGIHYCPHHPNENCTCRKPKPGLLEQIATSSGEDLTNQIFVGDSLKDILAAQSMGCLPALVLTGNGQATKASLKSEDIRTFADLLAFAVSLPVVSS